MGSKTIFQYVLAAIIVMGIFALLGILIKTAVPEINKDLLNIVIGSLLTAFSVVVGYFFGSSLGSAEKNEMLKKQ